MKSVLACIAVIASFSLASCAVLPPPPPGGMGGRPVARAVVYRPAPPKPKKQMRKAPPRLVYVSKPSWRAEPGRPRR